MSVTIKGFLFVVGLIGFGLEGFIWPSQTNPPTWPGRFRPGWIGALCIGLSECVN